MPRLIIIGFLAVVTTLGTHPMACGGCGMMSQESESVVAISSSAKTSCSRCHSDAPSAPVSSEQSQGPRFCGCDHAVGVEPQSVVVCESTVGTVFVLQVAYQDISLNDAHAACSERSEPGLTPAVSLVAMHCALRV